MRADVINEAVKAEILGSFLRVIGSKDASVIGIKIAEICLTFKLNPLQLLESELRKLQSPVFLVALSIEMMGDGKFVSNLPHTGETCFPYYLWIGVNGESEARKMLRQVGVTEEENFQNLQETGLLRSKVH